jgi:hypothetical protein
VCRATLPLCVRCQVNAAILSHMQAADISDACRRQLRAASATAAGPSVPGARPAEHHARVDARAPREGGSDDSKLVSGSDATDEAQSLLCRNG